MDAYTDECVALALPIQRWCQARIRPALTLMDFSEPLPIDSALPELASALRARNAAVLVAPPGAGKTTRVPLVLADEPWAKDNKILVLEPRRIAARAAAARMAATRDRHGRCRTSRRRERRDRLSSPARRRAELSGRRT